MERSFELFAFDHFLLHEAIARCEGRCDRDRRSLGFGSVRRLRRCGVLFVLLVLPAKTKEPKAARRQRIDSVRSTRVAFRFVAVRVAFVNLSGMLRLEDSGTTTPEAARVASGTAVLDSGFSAITPWSTRVSSMNSSSAEFPSPACGGSSCVTSSICSSNSALDELIFAASANSPIGSAWTAGSASGWRLRCREIDSPGSKPLPSHAMGASISVDGLEVNAGLANSAAGFFSDSEGTAPYFESASPGRTKGAGARSERGALTADA